MALNALDGMMARALNLTSQLGRALNEIGDVISDIAMYAPFGRIAALSPTAVSVAVILSVLTEIVGLAPTLAGGERRYDGPMGKSDRAVAFGLVASSSRWASRRRGTRHPRRGHRPARVTVLTRDSWLWRCADEDQPSPPFCRRWPRSSAH
jgi:hypothetical protein